MQSFGKFTEYKRPASDEANIGNDRIAWVLDESGNETEMPAIINGKPVTYIRDEKGNDWYDVRDKFNADTTLKIGYGDDGRVMTFCTDINEFFPKDMSAVELSATKANMRVALGANWFYRDGKLQQIIDYVAVATAERDRLMGETAKRIDWLTAAQEDGDISEEEQAELTALRTYRGVLRRLDLSTAPKINWPEVPQ